MAAPSRAWRVLSIAGFVVGLPVAACLGVAWIGHQVEENQASVGHLASAAEVRARMHRSPLTPVELIAGARERLADGYSSVTQLGGCLDGASGYLSHVPATVPEAAQAAMLDREIEDRMHRAGLREAAIVRAAAANVHGGSPEASVRTALAQGMTADFVGAGFHVGSFGASGDQGRVLVFSHARCDGEFLRGLTAAPEDRAALRALGFTTVHCDPKADVVSLTETP